MDQFESWSDLIPKGFKPPTHQLTHYLNPQHKLKGKCEYTGPARLAFPNMKKVDLFKDLTATYRKHGWQLKTVLMQPQTQAEIIADDAAILKSINVEEATVDALWFSRPSHNDREAWELRLLAETQYALFETFEPDETEELRNDARLEMEARLREYVSRD